MLHLTRFDHRRLLQQNIFGVKLLSIREFMFNSVHLEAFPKVFIILSKVERGMAVAP